MKDVTYSAWRKYITVERYITGVVINGERENGEYHAIV